MRTKIDKDVKKKEVVDRDPGDSAERKSTTPPKVIKKVKKPKKVEVVEDGHTSQEVVAPEVPVQVPDGVCGVGPDEVEAAVNSITEPCEVNSVEAVSEQVLIENHIELAENVGVPEPDPHLDPVPDLAPDPVPVADQNEADVKEVEQEELLEVRPKTPDPEKKAEPVVANYCTYDSVIEGVARGDIIVTTPPRKPPKKRRNDDCKSKEKLNFGNSEKQKKSVEKKKVVNSKKKTANPVIETSENGKEQSSGSNEQTGDAKTNEAGAKSRSKRTPKKRKFHDEQEDERAQVTKAKVIKKPSTKAKTENTSAKPSESQTEKTVSPKSKKSPKSKTKAVEESKETNDVAVGEKKEETEKVKKVKKEKSAKKSKKVSASKCSEEKVEEGATKVIPPSQENAQCSSDSGIGGTDSEMKLEGTVDAPVANATCVPSENGLPTKMETDGTEPSEQKPVEAKKKSKSSKPKKPKDSSKEKVNGLTGTDGVDVKEDLPEKVKTPKKSKAKKRKSEEGQAEKSSGATETKSEEQTGENDKPKAGESSAAGDGNQTDKPSPKKKKKKIVENGEGEVKKVVKKKKKVVKKPADKEEQKENGEVGPDSSAENGPVDGGSGGGDPKPQVKKEGESPEGDDSKEGSDIGDDESPEENRVKINKEKKVLETRECSLCGHKTRGLAALTRHMKRAHQIISKPPKFKCDRCEFDAAKRAVYAKHMLLHDVIMCSKCPYICSSNEALDEHVTEEHKNKGDLKLCRLCNRYVRCPEGDSTLEKHMEDCKGKVPLICKECCKEFKYESGLKIHISTHYPDQPKLYTCELCSYQSNYKANLHKHIQNIHQEREKTIKCQECDKMFYKEEHMRRHLRLHSENRPYNCEKCEKTFKSLCAMRNHMESHNPGRPFKCEFDGCTKSFRTAKFLKNHVEESHQMGEKRYHCSTEGCKFSFFKKSHLKRHEITHTGERNYHCTWQGCGKSFRHSDNLKVHQRQHTNEKPIKCSMCNFSCRQRNSLQWHIKRHHVAKEGSEVSRDGSQSGAGDNELEPKVNGVATPAASSDPCASVKSDGKGIDLYEFNDDDFCEELPVVFRREKPRFHVLTREDLDQLHEAAKCEPVLDPLPDWVKDELEAEAKEEIEKEIKKEIKKEDKKEKESPKEEPAKTPPKKKKKKVVASKKTPPKLVKKAKSPKAPKAPKSPKTPASPRTPKSPKSQGTKKKGSPETAKKKTVATKKKVSPQSKKAAASKKKSPAKKKETKSKAKAPAKKAKSKKVAKEEKKQEEPKEEEEKEIVEEPVEEPTPQAEPEDPVKAEVAEEPQPPSPQTLQKPQSPQSDGSSPSPHSPHSDRSEASPLLSDNDSDGEPQRVLMKEDEKVPELEEEMHMEENPEETFQEPVPDVPEMSKEEAMSPGQAQQEAIDRSLEENPIIDDSTLKDNHSQQDMRQYSPGMTEEVEGKVEENEQIEDEEEQRVSSDDEVTNDILLTPPRAPAPPSPPQSPSEEEEEEEEVVMQPVQSPVPVSVPLHEPLSHPEPMSNQPMSQDPQQPLPSVEPPKDEAQPPQPPAPQSAQYPHPTTTPECDKDYLGQYLQDLSVPANSARDSVPEEPNRLQRLEELAEKPHEDSRDIPRAASVASNVITHTSMQPFHDMSHKRMEILACDRSQEQHFQRDTASALPRLPDPPPFDSFNPLNSIHSVSRENNFLRQNENIFSTQTTGSSFMRLGDSEAMRQRMSTPFLPQNDRTAISRLPDTTLRPTNPALLRRPTTMPSTDMFPPPAMTQTMPRNPFTNTWSGQEVRPPHWPQAPYLQRTIDRQPNATPATLFAKENYLASRDFMFDPSRTMTERNMFASLSSPQPQRELAPETFPLELSYFGSHAYSGTATLDYSRPPCGTAPKAFDERYRQTASSAMSDFRGLPQTSSTEMFSGIGVNSSFNLDKYMYTRDPVYHPQHVGENTNSAFLTHSTPTQHSVFDREYPHRSLYPHQNTPYPFLEERQYSTAAKLTHTAGPSVNQERDFMPRSNTAENPIPPDPYRCGMLYNVMNRYSFE